jgi:malate dehydrogenase
MRNRKVSIIGAGNVGTATILYLAEKGVGDLVLVDVVEGLPTGKGLDIAQSGPMRRYEVNITGSNDFADTADSDVVVITAGLARKPGMSRTDLLAANSRIVGDVAHKVAHHAPNATLIIVTNPLDIMCYVALESSGLALKKVIGMAGILDSTRFRYFIAAELGVAMEDTAALVLGGHGDTMVPLTRYTAVGGIPVDELMDQETIDRLVERTRNGGAEIVQHLKTGSAFYAPAASIAEMVEAILKDSQRILPVAAYLRGEYGIWDVFLGVPARIGANGVEEVLELNLREDELQGLHRSADEVRQAVEEWKKMVSSSPEGGPTRERARLQFRNRAGR